MSSRRRSRAASSGDTDGAGVAVASVVVAGAASNGNGASMVRTVVAAAVAGSMDLAGRTGAEGLAATGRSDHSRGSRLRRSCTAHPRGGTSRSACRVQSAPAPRAPTSRGPSASNGSIQTKQARESKATRAVAGALHCTWEHRSAIARRYRAARADSGTRRRGIRVHGARRRTTRMVADVERPRATSAALRSGRTRPAARAPPR